MYTVGYVKDFVAFVLFTISLIILYNTSNINKYRKIIIYGVMLAIIADGVFSWNPEYHNTIFGNNFISYFVMYMAILFSLLLCILFFKINHLHYLFNKKLL